jgi:hypothetical protein
MDESQLKEALKTLSQRSIPNLPSNFNDSVWGRIRVTEAAAVRENWLDGLISTLLRPPWAAVSLAIALVIGVSLGRAFADAEAAQNHATLGLNVFSGDAPVLPSTLLSRPR